ncbi:hypothetical protein GN316_12970 [Xylophilus sp. Kf1]|nr:hypothetical protein [Xylophilus sp. Kf1]
MTIQPGDTEKMRKALGLPDAMSQATGSDIDPDKAAALGRKADADAAREQADADAWEEGKTGQLPAGKGG